MIQITPEHIQRLVQIESEIHYNEAPPPSENPFVVVRRDSPVLLSAPHGARTYRNNRKEKWHEEDEYTAGMALLLSELCGTSAIATTWRIDDYDPNWDQSCAYKDAMDALIREKHIRYVIDLHGAALHSVKLARAQTIDLGFRSEKETERSMDQQQVKVLENYLRVMDNSCDPACFVVGRNRFAAKESRTITTFAYSQPVPGTQDRVQAIQIEMKPQVRIAHRFTTATLYKSCGSYDADPNCIVHMLQALASFIEYLKNTV
ncbi:MAG: hypothetical protein SWK90_19355 [Chloroflexota bacterium]|nr:hypothetical protein [Chloroflexota bacterium]